MGSNDQHRRMYIAQDVISEGNRLLMLPYGPTWRMLHKTVHRLLGIQRAESYVPYQDLENKQMLFELLTQPDHFLESLRRFATSLTTSMTFGWRTTSLDDPRMIQLFDGVERFTELVQDVSVMMLDVFPAFRYLPAFLSAPKRNAREHNRHEKTLYKGY